MDPSSPLVLFLSRPFSNSDEFKGDPRYRLEIGDTGRKKNGTDPSLELSPIIEHRNIPKLSVSSLDSCPRAVVTVKLWAGQTHLQSSPSHLARYVSATEPTTRYLEVIY